MQDNFDELTEIFKALAHPVRIKIVLGLIEKNECNVTTMVEKLNMPQPAVSHHLNILKNAGIVIGVREATQICYRVTNETVKRIFKEL